MSDARPGRISVLVGDGSDSDRCGISYRVHRPRHQGITDARQISDLRVIRRHPGDVGLHDLLAVHQARRHRSVRRQASVRVRRLGARCLPAEVGRAFRFLPLWRGVDQRGDAQDLDASLIAGCRRGEPGSDQGVSGLGGWLSLRYGRHGRRPRPRPRTIETTSAPRSRCPVSLDGSEAAPALPSRSPPLWPGQAPAMTGKAGRRQPEQYLNGRASRDAEVIGRRPHDTHAMNRDSP